MAPGDRPAATAIELKTHASYRGPMPPSFPPAAYAEPTRDLDTATDKSDLMHHFETVEPQAANQYQ